MKLSNEQQGQIRTMTLAEKRQDEIAEVLGVHRNSVYRYQKHLGLHAWQGITEEEEKTILDLLKSGRGTSWIGKEIGCGEYQARRVAGKYQIHRRQGEPGYRWKPTMRQFIDVMNLAMDGKDSVASMARKVGGPYKPVLKLVHKIRECERFLTTRTLDSYLPMKHREHKIGTSKQTQQDAEARLAIADYINRKCFDGQLLAHASRLTEVSVEFCISLFRRERPDVYLDAADWDKVREYVLPHFREAVDALRLAENGLLN